MKRIEKINESLKREISSILQQHFQDSRLMFVTITKVSVSRDLQHAYVSYSVLGNEKDTEGIRRSLERLSGYIRKLIGRSIRMRYTPEIKFVYDKSIDYSFQIEQTFQEIRREQEERMQGKNHLPGERRDEKHSA